VHARRAHVVHPAGHGDRPAIRVHGGILDEPPEAQTRELLAHDLVEPVEPAAVARVDAPVDPDARHSERVASLAERHAALRRTSSLCSLSGTFRT
jgi:hypothetical protein